MRRKNGALGVQTSIVFGTDFTAKDICAWGGHSRQRSEAFVYCGTIVFEGSCDIIMLAHGKRHKGGTHTSLKALNLYSLPARLAHSSCQLLRDYFRDYRR